MKIYLAIKQKGCSHELEMEEWEDIEDLRIIIIPLVAKAANASMRLSSKKSFRSALLSLIIPIKAFKSTSFTKFIPLKEKKCLVQAIIHTSTRPIIIAQCNLGGKE